MYVVLRIAILYYILYCYRNRYIRASMSILSSMKLGCITDALRRAFTRAFEGKLAENGVFAKCSPIMVANMFSVCHIFAGKCSGKYAPLRTHLTSIIRKFHWSLVSVAGDWLSFFCRQTICRTKHRIWVKLECRKITFSFVTTAQHLTLIEIVGKYSRLL